MSSFEGDGPICRLWGCLSLQVGEINARKFVMGEIWRNFAFDLRFTHKLVRVSFLFHIGF